MTEDEWALRGALYELTVATRRLALSFRGDYEAEMRMIRSAPWWYWKRHYFAARCAFRYWRFVRDCPPMRVKP